MENYQHSVPKYKLASIYQGLRRLAKLVHKLTFYLSKTDRRIYGDRAIEACMDCLGEFILAYDFQDERPQHYMKLIAVFHKLQCMIDEINEENLVRKQFAYKDERDPKKGTFAQVPRADKLMLMIYNEIGKIDSDISKWRQVARWPCVLRQQTSALNPERLVARGSL